MLASFNIELTNMSNVLFAGMAKQFCDFLRTILDTHAPLSLIIIIMLIFKCYFSGELISLSCKKTKQQQQRCEHRIRKNKQIKGTVHDGNKKIKKKNYVSINKDKA